MLYRRESTALMLAVAQPGTPARASPIDTAVAATRVDTASARIAISCSGASGRGESDPRLGAPGASIGKADIVKLRRISIGI
jgi:hypothetical protein